METKDKKQEYKIEMQINCKTTAVMDKKGNLIISLPQYPKYVNLEIPVTSKFFKDLPPKK